MRIRLAGIETVSLAFVFASDSQTAYYSQDTKQLRCCPQSASANLPPHKLQGKSTSVFHWCKAIVTVNVSSSTKGTVFFTVKNKETSAFQTTRISNAFQNSNRLSTLMWFDDTTFTNSAVHCSHQQRVNGKNYFDCVVINSST